MAGFHVFDDSLQGSCIVIFIIFTPLCIVASALRLASSRIAFGKIGIEDYLTLGSLFFLLAWVAGSSTAIGFLNGRDVMQMTPEEISNAFKVIWASSLMFAPNQLCSKLSILFLYRRIFGINRTYTRWIKGLALVQILWAIETPLVEAFECTPVKKYWDITYVGGTCIDIGAYLAANETINSLIDLVMAALAVVMLRQLQISSQTKWKLGIVFAIGSFAGIIGFIKIGLAFKVSVHNQIQMGLWATLQMSLSIICCCVITYGPLFTRAGLTRRLATKSPTYGSKSHHNLAPSQSGHGVYSGSYVELGGAGIGRGNVRTEIGIGKPRDIYSRDSGSRDFYDESHLVEQQMKSVRIHQTVGPLGS